MHLLCRLEGTLLVNTSHSSDKNVEVVYSQLSSLQHILALTMGTHACRFIPIMVQTGTAACHSWSSKTLFSPRTPY